MMARCLWRIEYTYRKDFASGTSMRLNTSVDAFAWSLEDAVTVFHDYVSREDPVLISVRKISQSDAIIGLDRAEPGVHTPNPRPGNAREAADLP